MAKGENHRIKRVLLRRIVICQLRSKSGSRNTSKIRLDRDLAVKNKQNGLGKKASRIFSWDPYWVADMDPVLFIRYFQDGYNKLAFFLRVFVYYFLWVPVPYILHRSSKIKVIKKSQTVELKSRFF